MHSYHVISVENNTIKSEFMLVKFYHLGGWQKTRNLQLVTLKI